MWPQTKKKLGGQSNKTGKTCSWQSIAGQQKGSFSEAPVEIKVAIRTCSYLLSFKHYLYFLFDTFKNLTNPLKSVPAFDSGNSDCFCFQ